MNALSLLAAVAIAQFGPWVGVGMRGTGGSAPTASGVVDWTRCADGSTSYPCAATKATARPAGGVVTVTSAASLCASGSSVAAIGANDLCQTESWANIYGAAQHGNLITYSSDARSWSQRAGNPVGVTYSASGGPGNRPYSALVGVGAKPTTDLYTLVAPAAITANALVATGIMIRKVSVSGTLNIQNAQGVSVGEWNVDLSVLGSGWEKIEPGHPAVTVIAPFKATATGAAGLLFQVASGTINFDFALATQQNSAILGPPVETNGLAVTGVADVPSVPVTLTNPAKWAIGWKGKLPAALSDYTVLWTIGTPAAKPSATLYAMANGSMQLVVYDASAGKSVSVGAGTVAAGASVTVTVQYVGAALSPVVEVNAAPATVSAWSGVGSGSLPSLPTTLYIGSPNGAGVLTLSGSVSCVRQASTVRAARCL